MRLRHLWLVDFRSYHEAELEPALDGLTVIQGRNAQGKTNLLEAVGWLATLSSFRGAPPEALVREGAERAVVRAEGERAGRELLIECEVAVGGRSRAQLNRQPLRRARDLLGALRTSVFSPDDLELVKGGPSARRRYLDEGLVSLHPKNDALLGEVDRVLRQRNALLKQAGGRLAEDVAVTLDVWDDKLASAGEALAAARMSFVERLAPALAAAYASLAGGASFIGAHYLAPWSVAGGGLGLARALAEGRSDDVRRGVTLVGPHRDELALEVDGRVARTHASQGEQRTLSLALRLAAHQVVAAEVGSPPVLLLDDVFSELDPSRSAALVAHLPPGQALLTTAGPLPEGARPERVVRVESGRLIS